MKQTFFDGQPIRVAQLKTLTRKISGSKGVIRQPAVGDEGEVVGVTRPLNMPDVIEAEMVQDGKVIWRAEFAADEIEELPT